jgi:hypothetical protein
MFSYPTKNNANDKSMKAEIRIQHDSQIINFVCSGHQARNSTKEFDRKTAEQLGSIC